MSRRRRFKGRDVHGILLLAKPSGITSNDALQQVKRIYNAAKAGHTGALDPLATGMLPICLGEATKFSQFLLDADKRYQVTAKLGERTNTSDADGTVISTRPVVVSDAQLLQALERFRGDSLQVPSMFSALKHQGKPLYEYAREGIEVEREARPITVYELNLLEFSGDKLVLDIHCSKGTYIRTLCNDIGEKLGCGGCMEELLRTRVERFGLTDAVKLDEVQKVMEEGNIERLILPVDRMFDQYPAAKTTPQGDLLVHNGNRIFPELLQEELKVDGGDRKSVV